MLSSMDAFDHFPITIFQHLQNAAFKLLTVKELTCMLKITHV